MKNQRSDGKGDAVMGKSNPNAQNLNRYRLLVPSRGNLYIQNGIHVRRDAEDETNGTTPPPETSWQPYCTCIHDKSTSGLSAMDAQLSPDGSMVAWTCEGELYVQSAEPILTATPGADASPSTTTTIAPSSKTSMIVDDSFSVASSDDGGWANATETTTTTTTPAVLISFGASQSETCSISHGVADFVAQEEMDRYRGFWWHPDSNAILFTRNDESDVPLYRIMHHSNNSNLPSSSYLQNDQINTSQHYDSSSSSRGFGPPPPKSSSNNSSVYEDHRYPFAGRVNPVVKLALVQIDRESIIHQSATFPKSTTVSQTTPAPSLSETAEARDGVETSSGQAPDHSNHRDDSRGGEDPMQINTAQDIAAENWAACQWLDAPREANEYLARVHVLPDGCVIAQWQNRSQTCTVLYRIDLRRPKPLEKNDQPGSGRGRTLLVERSDVWINLHHMFHVLSRPIHPDECCNLNESVSPSQQQQPRCPPMPKPLPEGSFSFLFASERTGHTHLYLYTYCPGINGEQAVLLKAITEGSWIVESILGVDMDKDVVYFTGTYDSVLERHMYALPLLGKQNEHTWRWGAKPTVASPRADETQNAMVPSVSTGTQSGDESSAPTNGGTVRLGLSKVINALSGKAGSRDFQQGHSYPSEPDEILLVKNTDDPMVPTRISLEAGMHNFVMDQGCRYFVDTSSDLDRPTTVKIYELPTNGRTTVRRILTLYDAVRDDVSTPSMGSTDSKEQGPIDLVKLLPPPELLSFPTSDGTETLHAALYRPDPRVHGPGPYPLVCAVYGGPHVQRVNRSWSQSADMRAQRLRSLGFCLIKCDNRGSSRRGLAFESAIARRLGRLEVLDQVAAVRQLIVRGIVDPLRVGIYGWSYGGYLSAMCLCRAPDVFHVAVAGAPVTSWDGYDTHYTERYMGLPADNPAGYRESAVFDHVPNMRGKLMIVHGLIDENVHFRHTTRLINKLIAAGKDYDLLIFPEERHSPRRLRDRIYMEQRISEYFLRHLGPSQVSYPTALDIVTASLSHGGLPGLRTLAGHL
jgi:dienelactone hydrolase